MEYDMKMCDFMRQDILTDYGDPTLKEEILDLISKIEKDMPAFDLANNQMGVTGASVSAGGPPAAMQVSASRKSSKLGGPVGGSNHN